MIYGSVCSGIEAATMAWHKLGWTPAFFSEIDAFPSAVLAHHYGSNLPGEPLATNGVPNHGDFTQIGAGAGPVDLLVGGTPCQSFSVAGKRLGLDDPRGNLALEYLRLALRLGARWIVWENVPGVLSSKSGDEPAEEDEDAEGLESADFATFLSFVSECGYGFAYRVLDAQYIRVDDYARAVPQRRRRVILVGYLGDWRRAAAVLFEPKSMRGYPAPSREAGKGAAPTISSRSTGGGGLGTDFDLDGGLIPFDTTSITAPANGSNPQIGDPCHTLAKGGHPPAIAFGGGNTSGAIDVSTALTAHGHRIDFEVETFVAEIAATLPAGGNSTGGERQPGMGAETAASMLIAFNSREDPEVTWDRAGSLGTSSPQSQAVAIQAGALRDNPNAGPDGVGVQSDLAYTLEARAEVQAVAFDLRGREGGSQFEGPHDSANIRAGSGGSSRSYVAEKWAVRRLTPTECERLQGFPDGFTNVPWRGKADAPDGPRYKALGNSMAVNVMQWVGQRIDMMEKAIQEGRV